MILLTPYIGLPHPFLGVHEIKTQRTDAGISTLCVAMTQSDGDPVLSSFLRVETLDRLDFAFISSASFEEYEIDDGSEDDFGEDSVDVSLSEVKRDILDLEWVPDFGASPKHSTVERWIKQNEDEAKLIFDNADESFDSILLRFGFDVWVFRTVYREYLEKEARWSPPVGIALADGRILPLETLKDFPKQDLIAAVENSRSND